MAGRYVTLAALNTEKHSDALWECIGGIEHSDLWDYMVEGPFTDRAEFDAAMKHSAAQHDPLFFAIIDNETNLARGRASYLRITPRHRCLEVGHLMFSPHLQRTRHATEAMYLMMKYAFDLGYRRYEWKCNARNGKSMRAAERLGFRFEGVFRQHMIVKGRSRDTAWFAILDYEWPAIRRSMEEWLLPENFDAQGVQRKSLRLLMNRV